MTKVEQVALAIWQKKLNVNDGFEVFNMLTARDSWIDVARAAIQAMKEPTRAMRHASDFLTAEIKYPAMIDAALSETSEES